MIEAMKQSAEDVSKVYDILAFGHTERALEILAKTRTSLRQAIAELESQEPDYWLGYGLQAHTEKPFENATALYIHPPQRTWQGLTDDEHCDIWYKESLDWMEYGKAIEAKLKEKNT